MATNQVESGPQTPCKRCKTREPTLKIRTEPSCKECYCRYISTKTVKRLGGLDRDTRTSSRPTKRKYLVGLSFGPSSSALINIAEEAILNQLAKKQKEPFEVHAVHVDTDLDSNTLGSSQASQLLDRWRERYPRFTFESVPLEYVCGLDSIDWGTLPLLRSDCESAEQLRCLFGNLPSTTSRADLLRLLIRHILIYITIQKSCDALLLGCSTTALAELTLAETAKGRGFSLPWQINDGQFPVARYSGGTSSDNSPSLAGKLSIPLYYPLRDLFRKELITYGSLTSPTLTDLIVQGADKNGSVISHKDLSIEQVMSRYFEDVEENYPSVVTNVVRTTAKLHRLGEGGRCGACGIALDEQGDARWKGEIGDETGDDQGTASARHLCYGCERSIYG